MKTAPLNIAMLSIHSSPDGDLGTQDTGGMSVYVRELAREMGRRGHRVDIYTRRTDSGAGTVTDLDGNVRLIRLDAGAERHVPKAALYFLRRELLQSLAAFCSREGVRYDVIHSHYWISGSLGSLLQRSWQVPHFITFHTLGALKNRFEKGVRESGLRIAVERQLAQSCSRIIVASERERQHLARYDHVAGKNIAVIPCGVRLDRFYPLDKSAARRLIGFGPDDTLILYVGRFDPLKGIERLLQAIPLLGNNANPRLVIVGGDGDRSPATLRLRELARDLGIFDIVHFPGRVEHDRLSAYYSAAAVLVLPSSYESFGMVLLESLACGTPVVVTPVGDVEKFIQELENGTIVNNSSPAELARGIRKIIGRCRPAEAVQRAVRSSVERYSWSQIAGGVLGEYSNAVERNRKRPAARFYDNPARGVHARKPASAMCRRRPGLTAVYEHCIK